MKTCPSCHQALADDALFCPIDGTPLTSVESDPLLGSVIADRYVLLEQIGQGKSGTIYRAEHVVLRQSIAVKLLHQQLSQDQAAVERFRDEVTTLALLKSNSIVRGSDFGVTEDGRIFFAMEYLEGETLAATLGREGRFKEERALALLEQIGDALAEAHKLGFVHRDIRPRNIFLISAEEQEQIKLLDFGLAKLVAPVQGVKGVKGAKGVKGEDFSIGDPRYMSPEQARGDVADSRGDIYSLAIIAYEMVTGSPPFVGAGTLDVLTKHLEAQPVPISQKASDISAPFAGAVAYALHKRAKDRYSTVTRFLDALAGRAPVEDPAAEFSSIRKHRTTPSGQLPRVAPATKGASPPAATSSDQLPADKAPNATLIGTGLQSAEVLSAAKKQHPQQPKLAGAQKPVASSTITPRDPGDLAEADAATVPLKGVKATPAKGAKATPAKGAKATPAKGAKATPAKGAKATPAKDAKATPAKDAKAAPAASSASQKASAVATDSTKDFEERITDKIELQSPSTVDKTVPAAISPGVGGVSGSMDTSTPLAMAPSSSPVSAALAPAPAPAESSVVIESERAPGADISSPEFSLSKVSPSEEAPYQEEQLSQSTNWFAEGLAAEKQLATSTKSGPLPAIYSTMNEEEEVQLNRFSPAVVIGIVVGLAALSLLGFIIFFTGDDDEAAVVAAKSEAVSQKESAPEVKSVFQGVAAATPKATVEAPVQVAQQGDSAEPVIKPQAVALPEKKIEPKPKKIKPAPAPAKPKVRPRAAPPRPASKPRRKTHPRPRPVKVAAKKKTGAKSAQAASLAKAEVKAGQNSLKRGDYTHAKQSFTKALKLNPRSTMAYAGLGELAFEQGKYATATRHLRRAMKFSPRNSRILVMLGNSYFKQKKTKDAVAHYRRALKINPNNAAARAGLEASIRRLAGS